MKKKVFFLILLATISLKAFARSTSNKELEKTSSLELHTIPIQNTDLSESLSSDKSKGIARINSSTPLPGSSESSQGESKKPEELVLQNYLTEQKNSGDSIDKVSKVPPQKTNQNNFTNDYSQHIQDSTSPETIQKKLPQKNDITSNDNELQQVLAHYKKSKEWSCKKKTCCSIISTGTIIVVGVGTWFFFFKQKHSI